MTKTKTKKAARVGGSARPVKPRATAFEDVLIRALNARARVAAGLGRSALGSHSGGYWNGKAAAYKDAVRLIREER